MSKEENKAEEFEFTIFYDCSNFDCRYSKDAEITITKTIGVPKDVGNKKCNLCGSLLTPNTKQSFKQKTLTNN